MPAALVLGGVLGSVPPPCAAAQTGPAVSAAKCVGCGRCARIAKNTFAINPQKKKAYVRNPKGDSAELIARAAAKCRRKAITIQ